MNSMSTLESAIRYVKEKMLEELKDNDDKTRAISCSGLFLPWEPDIYEVGDIRTDEGKPYECMTAHDSITNDTWTIKERTLWKPYHSKEAKWALPWEAPTGAHDMYKSGEYMIFTDGKTYKCLSDTNYSPVEYEQAWEVAEE